MDLSQNSNPDFKVFRARLLEIHQSLLQQVQQKAGGSLTIAWIIGDNSQFQAWEQEVRCYVLKKSGEFRFLGYIRLIDFDSIGFSVGDKVLISDVMLNWVVPDSELRSILELSSDSKDACEKIRSFTQQLGNTNNLTFAVMEVINNDSQSSSYGHSSQQSSQRGGVFDSFYEQAPQPHGQQQDTYQDTFSSTRIEPRKRSTFSFILIAVLGLLIGVGIYFLFRARIPIQKTISGFFSETPVLEETDGLETDSLMIKASQRHETHKEEDVSISQAQQEQREKAEIINQKPVETTPKKAETTFNFDESESPKKRKSRKRRTYTSENQSSQGENYKVETVKNYEVEGDRIVGKRGSETRVEKVRVDPAQLSTQLNKWRQAREILMSAQSRGESLAVDPTILGMTVVGRTISEQIQNIDQVIRRIEEKIR